MSLPASPGLTPGFRLPFTYKSPCAPQSPLLGSWCSPPRLALPSRVHVPFICWLGVGWAFGPWEQPGALRSQAA